MNMSYPLSGKVVTEITNDVSEYVNVTTCNSEACYVRDINYSASLAQMVALIDISENCRQKFTVTMHYFAF